MRRLLPLLVMLLVLTAASPAAGEPPARVDEVTINGDIERYRHVRLNVSTVAGTEFYEVYFSDSEFTSITEAQLHSRIHVTDDLSAYEPAFENAEDCWYVRNVTQEPVHRTANGEAVIPDEATEFICDLSAIKPNTEHWFAVVAVSGNESYTDGLVIVSSISTVEDVVAVGLDEGPVLFAVGSIALSLIALFAGLWWMQRRQAGSAGYVYILPAILALALLTFYPVAYGFYLGFTDANETAIGEEAFNGLENFVEVFTASGFWRVTAFTLVWTVVNVVAHVSLGLMLAMLLNNHFRGRWAYRTALLLPWAIPSYISVLVWRGMFQYDGLVNSWLGTSVNFLGQVDEARAIVILVNIWLGVPFMMMTLSGALQTIPRELYEAAEVEGLSAKQQFRHITLPLLKPAMVPVTLLGFIWTFNMFNVIYLISDGGPNLWFGEPGATDILVTYVYDVAFKSGEYGLAAAWSIVIFVMLLVFSLVYMRQTNAGEAVR